MLGKRVLATSLALAALVLAGCGYTTSTVGPSLTTAVPTVTKSVAKEAIAQYTFAHGGLPKCMFKRCYEVGQRLGDLVVFNADPTSTAGAYTSTLYAVHNGHAAPLWSTPGGLVLSQPKGLVPGHQVLLAQVNGVGDNGLYHGPFPDALCGECPETIVRLYRASALTAASKAALQADLLWTTPGIAGTVQPIALLAHGRTGLLIQNDWLPASEVTYRNGHQANVWGDFAGPEPSDPGHVWQWDSYRQSMVIGQIGVMAVPIPKNSPYAGQRGVEAANSGTIVGPPTDLGGFGTGHGPRGLQTGAIITSADGKPVTTPAFLMLMIERTPIGATVRLKGNFNTAPFTTNAKVVPFPADWAPIYLQVQEGPVQLFL